MRRDELVVRDVKGVGQGSAKLRFWRGSLPRRIEVRQRVHAALVALEHPVEGRAQVELVDSRGELVLESELAPELERVAPDAV